MAEDSHRSAGSPGASVGRFRIVERLGAGGMGEVYLAYDPKLKRTVAIKRMAQRLIGEPKHRQRFLREAQMVSRLSDPHIAAVYDVLERDDEIFLVMERVEGKTLREFATEPMTLDSFLPVAKQCAQALAFAHGHGVVHRDIKPENIMVTPSGQVKILDFGLARYTVGGEEKSESESEPGAVSGTAGYMAPEALLEGKTDARSDIFSLGVVFYEVLSGRHPFRAPTYMATCNRVLQVEPPPPSSANPSLPAELDRVILRMLAKRPPERYATAQELGADLRWLEKSGTAPTMEAMPAPQTRNRAGSRTLWLAAAAVTIVLVALAIPRFRRIVGSKPERGIIAQPERQLAVLPFTVYDGSAAQRAFAAGLTDTITARLTDLSPKHDLAVVPASEIFSNKAVSPDMARQQFGVNLALTGSLQEAGSQVRVTYALVDTRTRRQVAAQTKTVAASDPFAVEDAVSNGVLGMLQLQLAPAERKTIEAKGTDKPGAYAFCLQGMGYLQNYEQPENIANAITVFQHALEIDPRYARAYAGLGLAYWQRYRHTLDANWTGMSRKACDRATAIDPELAAAHNCLGTLADGTGKYADAAEQFQLALAAEPTSDLAYKGLAEAYGKLGRMADAEQTYKKAIALRPQYWAGYSWLGYFYFQHGRYADAEKMFRQVVALVPDSFTGYSNLAAVYLEAGRFADAVPALEHSIAIRPNANAYSNLGFAEFYTHQCDAAAVNFEKAVRLAPNDYGIWRNVGDGYYCAPGKRRQADAAYQTAIEMAERALQVNPRDPDAYKILAVSRAMTGAQKQALAAIHNAIELAPDDPDAFYTAAIVYTELGELGKGMEWLKKALAAGVSPAVARNEPALLPLHGRKGFPAEHPDS